MRKPYVHLLSLANPETDEAVLLQVWSDKPVHTAPGALRLLTEGAKYRNWFLLGFCVGFQQVPGQATRLVRPDNTLGPAVCLPAPV